MAAVNVRKMKYSWLRGSFSEAGIKDYLGDMAIGRGTSAPVTNNKIPAIVSKESWDGKDGQVRSICDPLHQIQSHIGRTWLVALYICI